MKIENTEVYGFRAAFRAMRNPMDSWDKSDSEFDTRVAAIVTPEGPCIGPNDRDLACKLIAGGSEHRKFMRQIVVWVDMTLPRYVWTEMDTYKVSTVRNSCSTMHKLGRRALSIDDFEGGVVHLSTLEQLNRAGCALRRKDPFKPTAMKSSAVVLRGYDIVRYMKAILPESFLQKSTMTFNYETLLSMYLQRYNHRLPQWRDGKAESICSWIRELPYMPQFIVAVCTSRVRKVPEWTQETP